MIARDLACAEAGGEWESSGLGGGGGGGGGGGVSQQQRSKTDAKGYLLSHARQVAQTF